MGTIDFKPALELAARYVAALHEDTDPTLIVIYATGAGAGLQQLFWAQPGASRTLLEAQFPYAREALCDLIGEEPQQFCAQDTAIRMAVAAHARCRELAIRSGKPHAQTLGLGLTAAVATTPPKRGEHRVHIALSHPVEGACPGPGPRATISVLDCTFEKGRLSREEEGALCDLIALSAILWGSSAPNLGGMPLPRGDLGITSKEVRQLAGESWWHVATTPIPGLEMTLDHATLFHLPVIWPDGAQGTVGSLNSAHHLLFPGSFNPLHFGHEQMVRHAERMTGRTVVYTVNARHPDKGELSAQELLRRAEQFRWRSPLLVTRDEPLFVDKARAHPGFGFLIGADAVLGLLNPKYYGDTTEKGLVNRGRMLLELAQLETRFYVVGREVDGAFLTLEDVQRSEYAVQNDELFRHLFVPVSGRWDVASRNLRQR